MSIDDDDDDIDGDARAQKARNLNDNRIIERVVKMMLMKLTV